MKTRGESLVNHTGIYLTPAIQQVVNEVLFKNKTDDGIRWSKYYEDFPLAGFALAITAVGFTRMAGTLLTSTFQIECAINEWEGSVREMIMFKEHEYSSVFRSHLTSLQEFQTMTVSSGQVKKILRDVYNNGWYVNFASGCIDCDTTHISAHAGVPITDAQADGPKKAIPTHAFLLAIEEYNCTEGTKDQNVDANSIEDDGNKSIDVDIENAHATVDMDYYDVDYSDAGSEDMGAGEDMGDSEDMYGLYGDVGE